MGWTQRFQATFPPDTEPHEWASASSARRSKPQTKLEMPPGYDGQPDDKFDLSAAGATDQSNGVTDANVERGYVGETMPPTGDKTMFNEDVGGFVDRNNYLDRE